MESGVIFNIQRYSLHDGPGIRTTVFLKGCPLKCWWCHNPEGIDYRQELMINHKKCLACESCVNICPNLAIVLNESVITIALDRCNLCLQCIEVCPETAIELVGLNMTTQEVVEEVQKDRIFYDESGGGVTLSGGEPLMQPDFLLSLLQALKRAGIHTAVETSGYAGWNLLKRVAEWTDLFLFDLKLMDKQKSEETTGTSNEIILANLRKLVQMHHKVLIRIPVIPTVNDDGQSIRLFGEYLQMLGIKNVSLLPYHKTGTDKYKKIGQDYKLPDILPPTREEMAAIGRSFAKYGLNTEE
jgi:pyruvate formate lyase activating enzyme